MVEGAFLDVRFLPALVSINRVFMVDEGETVPRIEGVSPALLPGPDELHVGNLGVTSVGRPLLLELGHQHSSTELLLAHLGVVLADDLDVPGEQTDLGRDVPGGRAVLQGVLGSQMFVHQILRQRDGVPVNGCDDDLLSFQGFECRGSND